MFGRAPQAASTDQSHAHGVDEPDSGGEAESKGL